MAYLRSVFEYHQRGDRVGKIRFSDTGDTPYIDASDNIQIQCWLEHRLPVYDFVVSTGLSEQDEKYLNDNDIKKRRSYIYKFALEFFNTFIITKEEIKAEQTRLQTLQKEEENRKKQELQKAREQENAERKAWIERRAYARAKVRMDDSKSLPKKNLMKSFLVKIFLNNLILHFYLHKEKYPVGYERVFPEILHLKEIISY